MNFHVYVRHVTRCDLSYSNSHICIYHFSPANLILLWPLCTLRHRIVDKGIKNIRKKTNEDLDKHAVGGCGCAFRITTFGKERSG